MKESGHGATMKSRNDQGASQKQKWDGVWYISWLTQVKHFSKSLRAASPTIVNGKRSCHRRSVGSDPRARQPTLCLWCDLCKKNHTPPCLKSDDLTNACDSVDLSLLKTVLFWVGMTQRMLAVNRQCYDGMQFCVRVVDREYSNICSM